ncbi:MAG: LysR family transcriptional regulator [Negativicutes bacterium]|nr:LysR family transcriptional regulator [Negativicutes bacterium]
MAKYESFTKAADSLYLTQPTISKMIKSLEEDLEVVLIRRSTKKVELTDAGKVVLLQAKKIVESVQNLENELNDVLQLRKGVIRLGIPSILGSLYFSMIIAVFSKSFPLVEVKICEGDSAQLLEKTLAGEIDICAAFGKKLNPLLEYWEIVDEPLILMLPKTHPLAKKESLSFTELQEEKWILYTDGAGINQVIQDYILPDQLAKQTLCQSGQWDFIAELVNHGAGVALLPKSICQRYYKKEIAMVELIEQPKVSSYLAWRTDRYLSQAAKQWLEFSKNYFLSLRS